MVGKGCFIISAMIDAVRWFVTALFVAQILVDSGLGYPLSLVHGPSNNIPGETTRSKRSPAQLICQPKTHVTESSGVITSPRYETPLHDGGASCTWLIHVSSAQRVQLQFQEFNIVDTCPGICQCNYVAIKEPSRKANPVSRKYCNERKPPRVLSAGGKLKIHLRLKAGSRFKNSKFSINYWITSSKGDPRSTPLPPAKVARNYSVDIKFHDPQFIKTSVMKKTIYSEARVDEDQKRIRVRKIPPTPKQGVPTVENPEDDKEQGPSKLTVLLAVAIPVVMIFVLVVLIIAYYNHVVENHQTQGKEDIPNSGSALGDMILNSGATLAPMFNLKKAKRESSNRREKANQLYDDMLQSWKETHANRKEIMRAKQESVDVWESYQASRKQRRSARESDKSDSKAFAMLLSSAINVSTTPPPPAPPVQDKKEPAEKEEEEEVKPRPASSILINRIFSDDIHHKRSSKVLSWSDISTKSKEEPITGKRATSEMELKPRRGSGNIPAIVVSQPSFEVEDDESGANDTDKLIKDDVKDGEKETDPGKTEPDSSKPTYSCSEHVKDILRESYGEELEDWWKKEKKSEPQSDDVETKLEKKDTPGSLKHLPNSDVQDDATKLVEEDDVD